MITRILALAAVFVAAFELTSCGTTSNLHVGVDMPLPGGGRVTGEVNIGSGGDRTLDLESNRPICVKLCYSDSAGANLGCTTVELPAASQVPPGAVSVTGTIVPCPEPEGGGGAGMSLLPPIAGTQGVGTQQRATTSPFPGSVWETFGYTIAPSANGDVNVNFSFGIRAADLALAEVRRDTVLLGGIGTNTGAFFDIEFYSEVEAQLDASQAPLGVWIRQADVRDTFADYSLQVNGTVVADLATSLNVGHYSAPNGWDVVESLIPTSSFDTNATFSNASRADWSTMNRPGASYATASIDNL